MLKRMMKTILFVIVMMLSAFSTFSGDGYAAGYADIDDIEYGTSYRWVHWRWFLEAFVWRDDIMNLSLDEILQAGVQNIINHEGGNSRSYQIKLRLYRKYSYIWWNWKLYIACDNGLIVSFNRSDDDDDDDDDDDTDPCTPWDLDCEVEPPIGTGYTVTNYPTCGSRISGYVGNAGDCELQWNWSINRQWDASIECKQTTVLVPETQTGCSTRTEVTTYDADDNVVNIDPWTCGVCAADFEKPSDEDTIVYINLISDTSDSINSSTCGNATLADGVSQCTLTYNLDIDWLESNTIITGLQGKKITNIIDVSNNSADQTGGVWESALIFWASEFQIQSTNQHDFFVTIPVASVAPFVSAGNKIRFTLEWVVGTKTMDVSDIEYNFTKPFTGKLEASSDNGITWAGDIRLGTLLKYRVSADAVSSMSLSNLQAYKLSLVDGNVKVASELSNIMEVRALNINIGSMTSKAGSIFDAWINTIDGATNVTSIPVLEIDRSVIEYSLMWKTVKYFLSELSNGDDLTAIRKNWVEFAWMGVIWNTQLAWKHTVTGQEQNNTDVNMMTDNIIVRAKNHVAGMKANTIVWGVKYVEWADYTVTQADISNYETVVVKNGNVYIKDNVDKSWWKSLGIVVLSDNYNPETNAAKWNVYVTPNVTLIKNVSIYADGGLMSVDSNGAIYNWDSTQRTADLDKQLVLRGHLFTKNTVWWSQGAQWDYILPWWNKTVNFDTAMEYDLNYVRRGNTWWDGTDTNKDGNRENRWEKSPFVVIMASNELSNIPVIFKK